MNCCIVDLRLYYVFYTEFEGVVGGGVVGCDLIMQRASTERDSL